MTRNSDQRMLQPASIKFTSIQLPRLRTTTHNTKLAYTCTCGNVQATIKVLIITRSEWYMQPYDKRS